MVLSSVGYTLKGRWRLSAPVGILGFTSFAGILPCEARVKGGAGGRQGGREQAAAVSSKDRRRW